MDAVMLLLILVSVIYLLIYILYSVFGEKIGDMITRLSFIVLIIGFWVKLILF